MDRDPLDIWKEMTSSEDWGKFDDEQKEQVRSSFVASQAKGNKTAQTFLDYSTRPMDNVLDDPEFLRLPTDVKKGVVKAQLLLTGDFTKEDFGKDYGVVNKKGSRALNEVYRKFIDKSPFVEGAKSVPLAANALRAWTFGDDSKERGLVTTVKELQKGEAIADAYSNDPKNITPGLYTAGQVAGSMAVPGLGALPKNGATTSAAKYLLNNKKANIATNIARQAVVGVATDPLIVKGGTDKEIKEKYEDSLGLSALINTAFPIAGDIITSPAVKNTFEDVKRWVDGFWSQKGKILDLSDDVAKKAKVRLMDDYTTKVNQALANGVDPASIKKPTNRDVLAELKKEQANLKANKDEFGYTGKVAGGGALQDLQTSYADTDPDKIAANVYKNSPQEQKLIEDRAIRQEIGDIGKHVRERRKIPIQVQNFVERDKALTETAEKYASAKQKLFDDARATGALSGNLTVTWKEAGDYLDSLFKKNPKLGAHGVEAAFQPIIKDLKARSKGVLSEDEFSRFFSQMLETKPLNPQGAGNIDVIINNFNNRVLQGMPEPSKQVYLQARAIDTAEKIENYAIRKVFTDKDSAQAVFSEKPITRALSTNSQPNIIGESIIQSNIDEIKELDKTELGYAKWALASDIQSFLRGDQDKQVSDLIGLLKKYDGAEANVHAIFKGEKDLLEAFDNAMAKARSVADMKAAAFQTYDDNTTKGIRQAASAAAGQASKTRSGISYGVVELLAAKIDKRTRQLARETAFDKKLAQKLLDSAVDIQRGKINHADLYNRMTGARATLPAIARAVNVTQEETPTMVLKDPKKKQDTLAPLPEQGTVTTVKPLSSNTTEPLTDSQNYVNIDEEFTKANIPIQFKEAAISFAGPESNWGKNSGKNPDSSAKGTHQFIDSTWKAAEKAIGRPLDRASKEDNILATAWYAQENARVLKKAKLPITKQNLYLAHHFDGRPAAKLLKGGQAPAYTLVSENVWKDKNGKATSNAKWFFKVVKNGKVSGPRTAAEAVQKIKDYYNESQDEAAQADFLTSTKVV